jgi:hypothetical protein
MLQSLRRTLSSWIVLGLLGLIMIAFIITGFGTRGGGIGDLGGGPEKLAKVGSISITEQDLTRRLERELKRAQQQQSDLDMPRFIRLGAYEQVLDQQILEAALLAFADKHGIMASKRMVDAEIATIPAFQNEAGQFDELRFRQALGQLGFSEADLRQEISDRPDAQANGLPARAGRAATGFAAHLLHQPAAADPDRRRCCRPGQGASGRRTDRTGDRRLLQGAPGEIYDPRAPRASLRSLRME